MANQVQAIKQEPTFQQERIELAAAFRWAARMDLHEAVANHFSLAVNEDGTQFLMNPNQMHFSRIRASDLLLIDANDVIIHLFRPEVREFYGLERMWTNEGVEEVVTVSG